MTVLRPGAIDAAPPGGRNACGGRPGAAFLGREECEPVRRGRKPRTAVAVKAIETKTFLGHTRSIEVRLGVAGSRPDGTRYRQLGLTIIRQQAAQRSAPCSCPCHAAASPYPDAIAEVFGRIITAPGSKPRMLDDGSIGRRGFRVVLRNGRPLRSSPCRPSGTERLAPPGDG